MGAPAATGRGSEVKWGSVFGYLSGILLLGVFIAFSLLPQQTAEQTLADFDKYRTQLVVGGVLTGLLVVAVVPFFLTLRNAFGGRRATWAAAAAAFLIVGVVVLAALVLVQNASLAVLADVYAGGGAEEQIAAVVVARAVIGLFAAINLAVLALAAGVVLFGFAMWNTKVFPNWIASVGIVAGIIGVISLALPIAALAFILTTIVFVLFLAWVFGSAFFLSRSAARPAI